MDQHEQRRRVAIARVARLATVGADGVPHLVPVVFALVGDTVYSAVDRKPKRTMALRRLTNVRATGRASLLVDHYDDDWTALWWVRVDGDAEVLGVDDNEGASAIDALMRKDPQHAAERPAGSVVAVRVRAWRGWAAAG